MRVAIVLAIALGALAPRARAQPVTDAAALEASGQRHYELAEYAAAIADFKEAFRISDQPELLFDIAQAYRLSGDCKQAQTFYRTYLRRVPDAANADKVKARIAEMDACPAPTTTTAPTTTPIEPPPPPPPHRARTWKTWAGIGSIGAGAVGIGLGVVFAARGSSKADELRDACATSCSGTAARELEAQGHAANRNAAIGFAVGGALVATGVVLVILDRRGAEPAEGPAVSVARGGAIAGWTWSF
jgi:tetratricopeptide (TPR) repeat protein